MVAMRDLLRDLYSDTADLRAADVTRAYCVHYCKAACQSNYLFYLEEDVTLAGSMWTGCVSPCAVTMRSLAHVWRRSKRSMTSGGTEGWRRMRWSAPCGAVSKALRASMEKT